jgi:hypothetical protein
MTEASFRQNIWTAVARGPFNRGLGEQSGDWPDVGQVLAKKTNFDTRTYHLRINPRGTG